MCLKFGPQSDIALSETINDLESTNVLQKRIWTWSSQTRKITLSMERFNQRLDLSLLQHTACACVVLHWRSLCSPTFACLSTSKEMGSIWWDEQVVLDYFKTFRGECGLETDTVDPQLFPPVFKEGRIQAKVFARSLIVRSLPYRINFGFPNSVILSHQYSYFDYPDSRLLSEPFTPVPESRDKRAWGVNVNLERRRDKGRIHFWPKSSVMEGECS